MCGILFFHSNKINKSLEHNFLKSLKFMKNRGPNETLFYKKKNFIFGFNRLSINNISNGTQPFKSKCGRYILALNGEIFNYKELEDNLNRKGLKIKNASEIEIVFNYFKIYGENCVKYFRGFFAIIIYDLIKKKIFSIVDRLGIKQIYYYYSKVNNLLILTSDYSHLFKYKIFDLKIDKNSLMNFLCMGRSFGKKTIFKNIHDLRPGFKLNYNPKRGLKIRKYWSHFEEKGIDKLTKRNQLLIFNKLFLKSNKLWKKSEVEISNTLSTGVDSNLINYGFSKNNIDTKIFSIIENNKSNKVNKNFIYEKKLNLKLIFKELCDFTFSNKNPFVLANAGCVSLFQLYKKIKEHNIRVTFSGEGGDEIFGGYERYKKQLYLLKKKNLSFVDHIIKLYDREIKLFSKLNNFEKKKNIKKNLKKEISKIKFNSKNLENKILEFDQITWLPMLLRKHDNIGMHYSIEVRPQLLDHNLVEFVNNYISPNLKFTMNKNKIFIKNYLSKFAHLNFKIKKGTPSLFNNSISNKKIIQIIKKVLYNSLFLKKYFKDNILNNRDLFKKKNRIFLWRLFVICLMFSEKKVHAFR